MEPEAEMEPEQEVEQIGEQIEINRDSFFLSYD